MSVTEPKRKKTLYQFVGAPEPIPLRVRIGTGGTLRAWSSSVVMRVTSTAGTVLFTLTSSSGITRSTAESVSNALATIQLTVAQSRLLSLGRMQRYEVQDVESGAEKVFIYGDFIAEGGNNPDA